MCCCGVFWGGIDPNTRVMLIELSLQDSGEIDFEDKQLYDVEVTATDEGASQKSSTCRVLLYVGDVNDHPPIFSKAKYVATVPENTPKGSGVVSTQASDKDTGDNARLTFTIKQTSPAVDASSSLFGVDSETGTVLLAKKFPSDRETEYIVEVTATDNGDSPLSVSVDAVITVSDVNVNGPTFNQTQYTGTLAENAGANDPVVTVLATEGIGDFGPNAALQYSLPGDGDGIFQINADGKITLKKATLDRETTDRYFLLVEAQDTPTAGLPRTNQATVVVDITDFNDETPVLRFADYTASMPECGAAEDSTELSNSLARCRLNGQPLNLSPAAISATDADDPTTDNAAVEFSLEGDDSGSFAIDANGAITVVADPTTANRESKSELTFNVVVTDKGGGHRSPLNPLSPLH